MKLRYLAVLPLLSVMIAASPPADPAPAKAFRTMITDIRFMNGVPILRTMEGFYQGSPDFKKWKAVCYLPSDSGALCVGGGAKTLFMAVTDKQTSKDRSTQLCSFTLEGGLQPMRRMPSLTADFMDDERGTFVNGPSFEFTLDHGQTWVKVTPPQNRPPSPRPPDDMDSIKWIDQNTLVVSDDHFLMLYAIAADGKSAELKWTEPCRAGGLNLAVHKNDIWLNARPLASYDRATGDGANWREIQAGGEAPGGLAWRDDFLWIWSEKGTSLCKMGDDKMEEKAFSRLFPLRISPVAGGKALMTTEHKLYLLSIADLSKNMEAVTREDEPVPLELEIDNTFIDQAAGEHRR